MVNRFVASKDGKTLAVVSKDFDTFEAAVHTYRYGVVDFDDVTAEHLGLSSFDNVTDADAGISLS